VLVGNRRFEKIGASPPLPLENEGWVFVEPNPFNPAGNLRPGEAPELAVDLNDPQLPGFPLRESHGVIWIPAYTDFELHDITSGPSTRTVSL
jgi:hypothetical protein